MSIVRSIAISFPVFLAVLAAAALHAGWNALLKIRLDPFLALVLINGTCGMISLPFLVWFGLPDAQSWPWLAGSVALHLAYYLFLTGAYRLADMSQVYPIARGSAPLMTGLLAVTLFAEPLSRVGAAGIALLGLGIFVMSLRSAKDAAGMDRKALVFALLTAITISGYTVTDGAGARASGNPFAYTAALFVAEGITLTLYAWWRKGLEGLKPILGFLGPGFAGGAMGTTAYGIAIWAMTVAPIPLVAAVRETSVLFGAAIAVLFLKEPLRANRVIAAALILAGLVLIRLQ